MLPALLSILTAILGLLLGYYGRTISNKLNELVEQRREAREAKQVGVVRPVATRVTAGQPIDLSSDTGPVMRPKPAAVEEQRLEERDKILQENHR